MTTITINEEVNLNKTDFANYQEFLDYIIANSSGIEIESMSSDEKKYIEELDEYKEFKNIANSISF